jgi:hypothetical protein
MMSSAKLSMLMIYGLAVSFKSAHIFHGVRGNRTECSRVLVGVEKSNSQQFTIITGEGLVYSTPISVRKHHDACAVEA